MKFKIYKYAILFLLSFCSIAGFSQKQIHLFHGFGGSEDTWSSLKDKLTSCPNVVTTSGTYTSNQGLEVYNNEVIEALSNANPSMNDICISHSFGGMVARAIDQEGLYGGYITIGTAHDGLYLADAALNGELANYLESGCRETVDDPVQAFENAIDNSIFSYFFSDDLDIVSEATELLCEGAFQGMINTLGAIDDNNFQSVIDAKRGGLVANLPPSSIPSIGVSAYLESPVHWNMAKDFSGYDVPQIVDKIDLAYTGTAIAMIIVAAAVRPRIGRPWTWLNGGLHFGLLNTALELDEGKQWLRNSEAGYLELIGATGGGVNVDIQVEVPTNEPCMSDGECFTNQECIDQICCTVGEPVCGQGNTEPTYITVTQFIPDQDERNDGLVPVSGQQLPGALVNLDPISGVSHFAEPKHEKVHKKISDVFNGQPEINDIFLIDNCTL